MKPQQKALMQQSQKLITNYLNKYLEEVEEVIFAIESEETQEYVNRTILYIEELEYVREEFKQDTTRIIEGGEE